MNVALLEAISLPYDVGPGGEKILTPQAQQFLTTLHRTFNKQRLALLQKRKERQSRIDQGINPDFLKETAHIRHNPEWKVASTPEDLERRWVEITGPTDRKMMINALNSGADIFMADFEDANAPTWSNMIEGQNNLIEAIKGTISYTNPEGKQYRLNENPAVLMVRPRGWHLEEKHLLIDDEPVSASLFDFGLAFFHNAKALIKKGSGPYFYLPKLESHQEARLWNDIFVLSQETLGLPRGTIRATVLIETILAAFEMEEILFELRDHISGLNAGRWDYIFSIIKKFQKRQEFLFPDRNQITMTAPFMRAYTELLVRTCHKRGAHAMGGMAAFIPSRKDKKVNEIALAKVREDKLRESSDGFDGTWVAHPDLVPLAHEIFAKVLKEKSHQKDRMRTEVNVQASDLLVFKIPNGSITESGMRQNINVTLQYLDAWLCGIGAAAIYNLMEDAATAEISRAQLWQWLHHNAALSDGRHVTTELYQNFVNEEMDKIKAQYHENTIALNKLTEARHLLDRLVLSKEFFEFLTTMAYDKLNQG